MKQEKLESLAQELAACRECPLREAAQAPVGWFGNYDSPIVFVGVIWSFDDMGLGEQVILSDKESKGGYYE